MVQEMEMHQRNLHPLFSIVYSEFNACNYHRKSLTTNNIVRLINVISKKNENVGFETLAFIKTCFFFLHLLPIIITLSHIVRS